jgi:RimJ/RimL family protein N-acetyltransferase
LELLRLSEGNFPELATSLLSPTTWVCATRGVDTADRLREYLGGFVAADCRDESLTLVARVASTGEAAAVSRFHSASAGFAKVEIGFTWVADPWMRTFVNTEMKYLMIRHAFEAMGVKRVEFSVDPRNAKSNAAMTRLGAKLEGTLRKWRFLSPADPGDRNIYSIIDDEWPAARARFEGWLETSRR